MRKHIESAFAIAAMGVLALGSTDGASGPDEAAKNGGGVQQLDEEPPRLMQNRRESDQPPNQAIARPTRVKSVSELFPPFGEWPSEFKLISADVPHFQITVEVAKGHSPQFVSVLVKSAIVDSIFRTFIHTERDRVRVTALPALVQLPGANVPLPKQMVTVDVERKDVLRLLSQHVGLESFDDLVGAEFLGEFDPDMYRDVAFRCLTNDDGSPTVERFFAELNKVSK